MEIGWDDGTGRGNVVTRKRGHNERDAKLERINIRNVDREVDREQAPVI